MSVPSGCTRSSASAARAQTPMTVRISSAISPATSSSGRPHLVPIMLSTLLLRRFASAVVYYLRLIEPQFSFSIQLLTKNPARRYKVAHAWRRRCLARPYAGTKIVNVTSDTGEYLAYLLLPVCSVMASAAGIFTACVPATFVVAAKSRADQGLAKACAETKIDNVPGDTGARP